MSATASGRAWALLVASGVLEAVWAASLASSDGFSRPGPTALFLLTVAASTVGLARAMRVIGVGTAYAVWTGIGTLLTVAWSVTTGAETLTPVRALLLAGIVGCVVGLKLVDGGGAPPSGVSAGRGR